MLAAKMCSLRRTFSVEVEGLRAGVWICPTFVLEEGVRSGTVKFGDVGCFFLDLFKRRLSICPLEGAREQREREPRTSPALAHHTSRALAVLVFISILLFLSLSPLSLPGLPPPPPAATPGCPRVQA